MGFLYESEPLSWEASLPHLRRLRLLGLQQFVRLFQKTRGLADRARLRWGDEVEFPVVKVADGGQQVQLSLRSAALIAQLLATDKEDVWQPEYGGWMVETTPGKPYEDVTGLDEVEDSIARRRRKLQQTLEEGELIPMLTTFPRMGVGFSGPDALNAAIYPHSRFQTLTRNIRARRGEPVAIRRAVAGAAAADRRPEDGEFVTADAMAYGMGCCCLQVTVEARNFETSRKLYDVMAIFAPLLMAIFAASPFLKDKLTEDDARWAVISQSVDDRTAAEAGRPGCERLSAPDERLAGDGVRTLRKSRYDSADLFIHPQGARFNDVAVAYDRSHLDYLLLEGQLDEALALHVAHLFARDPLVLFADRLDEHDGPDATDHWEAVQSTNWQSVRWKPPSVGASEDDDQPGYRVEMRTLDLQPSAFENAAAAALVVTLAKAASEGCLAVETLYVPMSAVEENMRRATKKDALVTEKFFFRKKNSEDVVEMPIAEIFHTWGILDLCLTSYKSEKTLNYFEFIRKRIENEIPTVAQQIRSFVLTHPAYKLDSTLDNLIATDLCLFVNSLAHRSFH